MAQNINPADRPIGVFDSGLGGLTVVHALKRALPKETIYYYGDTAHLPYGDKAPEAVVKYAQQISLFLLEQEVKALVIACNTASALASSAVRALAGATPVYEVITPTAQEVLRQEQPDPIGVLATAATVESHAYANTLHSLDATLDIREVAAPTLVSLIEEGIDDELRDSAVAHYLRLPQLQEIRTLVLGCTHYPLLYAQFESWLRAHHQHPVRLISSSEEVARAAAEDLLNRAMLREPGRAYIGHQETATRTDRYWLSECIPSYTQRAERFLGYSVRFGSHTPDTSFGRAC